LSLDSIDFIVPIAAFTAPLDRQRAEREKDISMDLYTVRVDGRPVLVISTDAGEPPQIPDGLVTDPQTRKCTGMSSSASA
jgi:hypothetical protein